METSYPKLFNGRNCWKTGGECDTGVHISLLPHSCTLSKGQSTSTSWSISTLKSIIFTFDLGKIMKNQYFEGKPLSSIYLFLLIRMPKEFITWSALLTGNPIEPPATFQRLVCLWSHPNDTRFCKQSEARLQDDTRETIEDSFMGRCFPNWKDGPHNDLERRHIHYDKYPESVVTSCDFILWVLSEGAWRNLKHEQHAPRSSKSI